MTIFTSDPYTLSADLMGLARITMDHGKESAKKGMEDIRSILDGSGAPGLNIPKKKALGSCSNLFLDSVNSFVKALDELDKDIPNANSYVSEAGDNAKACRDNLFNANVSESLIDLRIYYMQLYSAISVLITGILDGTIY
ncbi:hypothetical protein LINGRAHAP2_LOCUS36462 [Linum grandiflorum]